VTQPLSPAAQFVWDALDMGELSGPQQLLALAHATAALRAAVDQVVPHVPTEAISFTNEAIRLNRMSVRAKFLAIVTELEGHQ
jgi:hypothetical protein